VFACSSTSSPSIATDAAVDTAATSAPVTCVVTHGECAPGCCPQEGYRYDPTVNCVASESQVIGCTPKPASTGCGTLAVIGCAITPEGTFYTPGTAAGWEPKARCDDALQMKVTSAKSCAGDAGTD
jgi:hypothetical protein